MAHVTRTAPSAHSRKPTSRPARHGRCKRGTRPPPARGQCDAAPIFGGTNLYLASNGTTINGTTINGTAYDGSVAQVDPAAGAIVWQTGLTGPIIGTPGMDGAGVIAAASYSSTTQQNGPWLIDAATGQILKSFNLNKAFTFGQPVFADNYLFVATKGLGLRVYEVK